MNDIEYHDDIVEDGNTFAENSLIKAKTISEYLHNKGIDCDVLADDSGLCCEALDGAPGIYSARYAGGHGNDKANRDKLIEELKDKDKKAYFICSLVLYKPDNTYINVEGKTYGTIIDEEKGELGKVQEIIEYPTQSLIQVLINGKEVLIPIHDDIIKNVDREGKKIFIKAPNGLIDMYLEN
jgi:non-canonical purine NTP pyrophosphatase (RdgB/HAM1 family)